MSDPFLPIPPEEAADLAAARDEADLEDDAQPDVLVGGEDSAGDVAAAADADEPDLFPTPHAGDRLTAEELEADLG